MHKDRRILQPIRLATSQLFLATWLLSGCFGDEAAEEGCTTDGDCSGDGYCDTTTQTCRPFQAAAPCTAAGVCLTFFVDDRNNLVYDEEAELQWKGSFRQPDPAEAVIEPDPDWSGPFPRLYDDGPVPAGHEMPGAVAHDHIWSTLVRIAPPASGELVLTYGAQLKDGWIWSCANASRPCEEGASNGIVRVTSEDAGKIVDATGLVMPAFGRVDLKLTLDTHDLASPADFADLSRVMLKTSHDAWVLSPCSDDGTRGDEQAGDGEWTCVLSEIKSKYMGLLSCGTQVSFVFTLGGNDQEYLVEGRPSRQGVRAWLGGSGLSWSETAIANDPSGPCTVTTLPCL